MGAVRAISVLAFAAQALAHGYVYRITADNTVYPGWDVRVDPLIKPAPARIAFGGGGVGPMTNISSPDMACSRNPTPAPGMTAEVRAGSNMTFYWSHWLYSHKGPITAWMAPYSGNIADVKVNDLEFFKIAEDTVDDNGVWGTVRMMDKTNHTWTATIPADIRPGTYIIRQEVCA
ncbi:glycoside hydrolase [Cercophora newfieldiana]|uniref:lytic cellulose monooxygenase (C4-dehydrogenating) n=1 Tax=Cercophora newfieldiana TaxID=92897 RepID=A0AA40CX39_9PEZI|nr:glycoside hydrolase [Cercophora newfieldiana]